MANGSGSPTRSESAGFGTLLAMTARILPLCVALPAAGILWVGAQRRASEHPVRDLGRRVVPACVRCRFLDGRDTPAFDRIAREGALFRNAYAPAPGCSPTPRRFPHWPPYMDDRAVPARMPAPSPAPTFPTRTCLRRLATRSATQASLGGAPGRWEKSGRTRNPAGPAFMERTIEPPYSGIRDWDYAGNFEEFFEQKPAGQPFSFWVGGSEATAGSSQVLGGKAGKRLEDAEVPPFLPDTPEIRSDLLDYAVEIEWFDSHVGRILEYLEAAGELENTLVIMTADNGMAFPRAKANVYDYGIHMPLAVRWSRSGSPRTHDR